MTAHSIVSSGVLPRLRNEFVPSSNCERCITRCCILGPGLSDWIDLLEAFDAYGIKYLIVGGIAVGFHGTPRYTKDLDLLVHVQAPDHERVYRCLAQFGAPVSLISPEELLEEDFIFHFGAPPWRVDILTSIPGVDFDKAYEERVELPFGSYRADCISKEWLIRAKRASGRPQDLLDLQSLSTEP